MKKINTWMKIYPVDYLNGTKRMTYEEKGVYIDLILEYWDNGGPLGNEKKMKSFLSISAHRWNKVKENVLEKFYEKDGVFHHERIDKEIAQAIERREKARKGGVAKAKKQAPVQAARQAARKHCYRASSPGPSPSPLQGDLSTEVVTYNSAEEF